MIKKKNPNLSLSFAQFLLNRFEIRDIGEVRSLVLVGTILFSIETRGKNKSGE